MSEEYYDDEWDNYADEYGDNLDAGYADEVEDALADMEAYEDAAYDDSEDAREHVDASARHPSGDRDDDRHSIPHSALLGAAAGYAAARTRRSRVHEYTESERRRELMRRQRQSAAGRNSTAEAITTLIGILALIMPRFVCC